MLKLVLEHKLDERWDPDKNELNYENYLVDAKNVGWIHYGQFLQAYCGERYLEEDKYAKFKYFCDGMQPSKSGNGPFLWEAFGLIASIEPNFPDNEHINRNQWKAFFNGGRLTPKDAEANRQLKLQKHIKWNETKYGIEQEDYSSNTTNMRGESTSRSIKGSNKTNGSKYKKYYENTSGSKKVFGKSNDGFFQSRRFAKRAVQDKFLLEFDKIDKEEYLDYNFKTLPLNEVDGFISKCNKIVDIQYKNNKANIVYLNEGMSLDVNHFKSP